MTMQPSPPSIPQAPVLSAQDRAEFAQAAREAAQAGREAAQAAREATSQSRNVGVVTNATGQIVVTGPNGKTITIDPKAGLDGDQIQAMVQTALQPTETRDGPNVPPGVIPLVSVVMTFLFLIALVISRAVSGRRAVAGGATTAALSPEATARLARIEQAVEAVAIEVERISEAQRYSAQLLTDRLANPAPTIPVIGAAARGDRG